MKFRVLNLYEGSHFTIEMNDGSGWKDAGYHVNGVGNTFRLHRFETLEEAKSWIKEKKAAIQKLVVYEEEL